MNYLTKNFQQNILSIKNFTRQDFGYIFRVTEKIMQMNDVERKQIANGKILGYAFYEPSTRTRLSFQAAMYLIGGTSIGIENGKIGDSNSNSGFFELIKTLELNSDVIVFRHPSNGIGNYVEQICTKPMINGGIGFEEHPTQALLDLFTIQKEKGKIDGLKIGLFGDMRYGRTIFSLLRALAHYNVEVYLISPPELKITSTFLSTITGIKIKEYFDLKDCIDELDVIYANRIKKERIIEPKRFNDIEQNYSINLDALKNAKKDLILLHCLPRNKEILPEVDKTKFAKYFQQAEYGLYVRAALLALIINKEFFFITTPTSKKNSKLNKQAEILS